MELERYEEFLSDDFCILEEMYEDPAVDGMINDENKLMTEAMKDLLVYPVFEEVVDAVIEDDDDDDSDDSDDQDDDSSTDSDDDDGYDDEDDDNDNDGYDDDDEDAPAPINYVAVSPEGDGTRVRMDVFIQSREGEGVFVDGYGE